MTERRGYLSPTSGHKIHYALHEDGGAHVHVPEIGTNTNWVDIELAPISEARRRANGKTIGVRVDDILVICGEYLEFLAEKGLATQGQMIALQFVELAALHLRQEREKRRNV